MEDLTVVVEGDTIEPFKLCRMLIAPWYKATFTRLSTRYVLISVSCRIKRWNVCKPARDTLP